MESIIDFFAFYPVLVLFLVISLGYLLGKINFGGFRLGVAGVLIVGLGFGALSPKLALPEIISSLGLIIFSYATGIIAGPEVKNLLNRSGKRDNLFALGILIFSTLLMSLLSHLFGLSSSSGTGVFCGTLTTTPSLAAVRETLMEMGRLAGLSRDQAATQAAEPVLAYSLAYPVGVLGVMLSLEAFRRIFHVPPPHTEPPSEILIRSYKVTNPGIFGRTVAEVMRHYPERRFMLSRIRHEGKTRLAMAESVLLPGDIIVAVGEGPVMLQVEQLLGSVSDEQIQSDHSSFFDFHGVIVSSRDVVGKRISELGLIRRFSAMITRVRRRDVEMLATSDIQLEYGDRVRVFAERDNFRAISEYFGDSIKSTAAADYGAMAIGMVIGVLVGLIPFPIPGGFTLRLGFAGGPLIVAMILSSLKHTGKVTWLVPVGANLTLQEIGLLFFIGCIGTRAGAEFLKTVDSSAGLAMLVAAAALIVITTFVALFIGHFKLRLPYDYLMGLIAGIQTQSAVLAYAKGVSNRDEPNIAFTSVYPIATLFKIIAAQVLLRL